ncbi:hypothetical protein A8709_14300 [Paenibacillus pectinilyticus]|uniref:DNA-binding response regulator n=1 Tax=Paenibacillus pectinilyticus TaxID=512399 RepID=A0A1C1A403_9BACL|nr:response regulator [Paenibacillus pectinilyticus]OCT15266.1 hypothetical protein A8709_14300 [Paenibacillus pectinilyticus]
MSGTSLYKVIIAEDEMLVRIGIKHTLEWKKYGMHVVADVANGQEALEAYQEYKPDILITDIKMPLMDGMALISHIRKTDSDLKIVILTNLVEFELAREAMNKDVSGYIIKVSMTNEEIAQLLSKLKRELDERTTTQMTIQHIDSDVVKEHLCKDFLFRNRYSETEFADIVTRHGLRLTPSRLVTVQMEIDQYDKLQERYQDHKGQLIRMSLLNILEEVLAHYDRGEIIFDSESRFLTLFSFEDITSEHEITAVIQTILAHMRKVLLTYFNVTVTFAISAPESGYGVLKRQYEQGIKLLQAKYWLGTDQNLFIGNGLRAEGIIAIEVQSQLKAILNEWPEPLQAVYKQYERTLGELLRDLEPTKETVQSYFQRWLHMIVLGSRMSPESAGMLLAEYTEQLKASTTLSESVNLFTMQLQEIGQLIRKRPKLSREVSRAVDYIEAHYNEELSLQQIADTVQMSAKYFSTLFKKEMGIGFVEYWMHYRVEKAKELLLSSSLRSYEISDMLGFADHSYFSRTFRKVTGMSPREFRNEQHIQDVDVDVDE